MMKSKKQEIFIGVESGATGTVAILAEKSGKTLARVLGGPLHPDSAPDASGALAALLKSLGRMTGISLAAVRCIVICIAGVSVDDFQAALAKACRGAGIHPRPLFYPDIFSTLVSELTGKPGIIVVAGTGSCVLAQDARGHVRRCGGWGTLLGDEGSGYALGIAALKTVLDMHDGIISQGAMLAKDIGRCIGRDTPQQILNWSRKASKDQIAMLAPVVLAASRKGDAMAAQIVQKAVDDLIEHVLPLFTWLQQRNAIPVRVILTGGLVEHHQDFANLLGRAIEAQGREIPVSVARARKGEGALQLALGLAKPPVLAKSDTPAIRVTETANPRSLGIDTLPAEKILQIVQEEDMRVPQALLSQLKALAQAVEWMVTAVRSGGRVFYVGAGTSGRLAALDAAELVPTFHLPEGVFEVIVAGGKKALTEAVEGAEDDTRDAPRQLSAKRCKSSDIIVGIAASGSTPFVLSAMRFAKGIGAKTIAVTCNAHTPLEGFADLAIVADVGPEIIGGSTRMKAGTATKLILNSLSTVTMIRLGKVMDHWMVEVAPTNKKLRARAIGIVRGLTGCNAGRAEALLKDSGGNPKTAVLMGKKRLPRDKARARLRATGGSLRAALAKKDE